MKNNILICFGTRPEWLKIKPLVNIFSKFNTPYKLLFTGQHKDLLKEVEVDYRINITETENERLDQIISDCLLQFPKDEFDYVLVQGDTASTFACALAAFHRKIKIIYLEAGLRTFDLNHPYPEEAYRQMISRISDINLCPTKLSAENLNMDGVLGKIYVTGNTVLDNLVDYKKDEEYTETVLVTMHRRENHDIMDEWFTEINDIAKRYPKITFILPLHPNPNVVKHKDILTDVRVVDSLSHEDLIQILVKCKFVITDSGGIQEEASFFNKKVIVCREETERPEGIKTGHLYMCHFPEQLSKAVDKLNTKYYINTPCPYGYGYAAFDIHVILQRIFNYHGQDL